MRGKVLFQHVKELHQARRDVLCLRQVGRKGHLARKVAQRGVGGVRLGVRAARGRVSDPEEARGDGVELVHVKLKEVAVAVNQHVAL